MAVGEVTKEEIHEFIEFYNGESTSVNLENYKVASSKSGLTRYINGATLIT